MINNILVRFLLSLIISFSVAGNAFSMQWINHFYDSKWMGCIPAPDFSPLKRNNITVSLSSGLDKWTSAGVSVDRGKSIKFAWDLSSLYRLPIKMRVLYRIDPRFLRPQVITKFYSFSQNQWISTFDTFQGSYGVGSLPNYQSGQYQLTDGGHTPDVKSIMNDLNAYFSQISASTRAFVRKGQTVNISLISSGDFFNTTGYPSTIDPDNLTYSPNYTYVYTSSKFQDNAILYLQPSAVCNSASFAPVANCTSSITFQNGNMALFPLGMAGFTSYAMNRCASSTTGYPSSACYYDLGRGMAITIGGVVVKNENQSFSDSAVTGQSFFSVIAANDGWLDFSTSWNIANMFSNFTQDMTSLANSTPPPLSTMSSVSLNYMHLGRYIMEVEIGDGNVIADVQGVVIEYAVSSSSPDQNPDVSITRVMQNNEVFAPSSGNLWIRVRNEGNQDIRGNLKIYYANYTGDTTISSFVMNDIVSPIVKTVTNTASIIYMNFTRDGGFRTIAFAMLNLYVVLYALFFLLGAVEIKVSDIVNRLIKIAIIVALFSENSWVIFNEYFFNAFINGGAYLMNNVLGTSSSNNMFGFMDFIFAKFLDMSLWGNLIVELLQVYNGLFIFGFIVIKGVIDYFFLLTSIVTEYIMSFIMMCILISMAPIFITFMLFKRTSNLFSNWLSAIFNAAIYPTILLVFVLLINDVMTMQLQHAVVKSCWNIWIPFVFSFKINIGVFVLEMTPIKLEFLPGIPFYVPEADNGVLTRGASGSYLTLMGSSISFYLLSRMAKGVVPFVTSIVGALTASMDLKPGSDSGGNNLFKGVASSVVSGAFNTALGVSISARRGGMSEVGSYLKGKVSDKIDEIPGINSIKEVSEYASKKLPKFDEDVPKAEGARKMPSFGDAKKTVTDAMASHGKVKGAVIGAAKVAKEVGVAGATAVGKGVLSQVAKSNVSLGKAAIAAGKEVAEKAPAVAAGAAKMAKTVGAAVSAKASAAGKEISHQLSTAAKATAESGVGKAAIATSKAVSEKAKVASAAVSKTASEVKGKVSEKASAASKAVSEKASAASKAVSEKASAAGKAVSEKASTMKKKVVESKAAKAVVKGAEKARAGFAKGVDFTKRKASEASKAASDIKEKVVKSEAAKAVVKGAEKARAGVAKGVDFTKRKAKAAGETVSKASEEGMAKAKEAAKKVSKVASEGVEAAKETAKKAQKGAVALGKNVVEGVKAAREKASAEGKKVWNGGASLASGAYKVVGEASSFVGGNIKRGAETIANKIEQRKKLFAKTSSKGRKSKVLSKVLQSISSDYKAVKKKTVGTIQLVGASKKYAINIVSDRKDDAIGLVKRGSKDVSRFAGKVGNKLSKKLEKATVVAEKLHTKIVDNHKWLKPIDDKLRTGVSEYRSAIKEVASFVKSGGLSDMINDVKSLSKDISALTSIMKQILDSGELPSQRQIAEMEVLSGTRKSFNPTEEDMKEMFKIKTQELKEKYPSASEERILIAARSSLMKELESHQNHESREKFAKMSKEYVEGVIDPKGTEIKKFKEGKKIHKDASPDKVKNVGEVIKSKGKKVPKSSDGALSEAEIKSIEMIHKINSVSKPKEINLLNDKDKKGYEDILSRDVQSSIDKLEVLKETQLKKPYIESLTKEEKLSLENAYDEKIKEAKKVKDTLKGAYIVSEDYRQLRQSMTKMFDDNREGIKDHIDQLKEKIEGRKEKDLELHKSMATEVAKKKAERPKELLERSADGKKADSSLHLDQKIENFKKNVDELQEKVSKGLEDFAASRFAKVQEGHKKLENLFKDKNEETRPVLPLVPDGVEKTVVTKSSGSSVSDGVEKTVVAEVKTPEQQKADKRKAAIEAFKKGERITGDVSKIKGLGNVEVGMKKITKPKSQLLSEEEIKNAPKPSAEPSVSIEDIKIVLGSTDSKSNENISFREAFSRHILKQGETDPKEKKNEEDKKDENQKPSGADSPRPVEPEERKKKEEDE